MHEKLSMTTIIDGMFLYFVLFIMPFLMVAGVILMLKLLCYITRI